MTRRALLPAAVVLSGLLQASLASGQGSAAPDAGVGESLLPGSLQPGSSSATLAPEAVTPAPADAVAAFGVSGALRAAVLRNSEPVDPPLVDAAVAGDERPRWVPIHGTVRRGLLGEPVGQGAVIAPDGPGMWRLEAASDSTAAGEGLTFITTVPFSAKRDGHINDYHIGTYPTEISPRADVYAPPAAFIEVTPENQDVRVSEHFQLKQFLTKDQFDVWPKYLALNLDLVDKLELVIDELNAMGVRALGLHVMSGFRTPQYNGPGGDGRATLSRHMYGDAADIWVDGDHDGYIDDLNGDGRHDIRDAEVLLRAVERVEQKYPELTGGAGLYEANHAHGPYVHVDVRGNRARW